MFYPKFNERLTKAYPSLPEAIKSDPIIRIFEVEDRGPATKFIYLNEALKKLGLFSSENKVVIYDDDKYYAPGSISLLYKHYLSLKSNDVMVGFGGVQFYYYPFQFNRSAGIYTNLQLNRVAVLEGACMVMCAATVFPPSKDVIKRMESYGLWIKTNDDLLLSSIAYKRKIRLYAIQETPSFRHLSCADSIHKVNKIYRNFGKMAIMQIYLILRFKLPLPMIEIILTLLFLLLALLYLV